MFSPIGPGTHQQIFVKDLAKILFITLRFSVLIFMRQKAEKPHTGDLHSHLIQRSGLFDLRQIQGQKQEWFNLCFRP